MGTGRGFVVLVCVWLCAGLLVVSAGRVLAALAAGGESAPAEFATPTPTPGLLPAPTATPTPSFSHAPTYTPTLPPVRPTATPTCTAVPTTDTPGGAAGCAADVKPTRTTVPVTDAPWEVAK